MTTKLKLSDLRPHSAEIEVIHPVLGPLGAYITIVGKFSKQFSDASKAILRDKDIFDHNFEIADAENTKTIAACCIGWSDDEFFGGEFSAEAMLEWLNNPEYSYIKDSLQRGIQRDALFFRKPEAESDNVGKPESNTGYAGPVRPDSTETVGTHQKENGDSPATTG